MPATANDIAETPETGDPEVTVDGTADRTGGDQEAHRSGPVGRWPDSGLLGAGALALAALIVAAWFGLAWISSAGDASLGRAKARDEVDRVARASIITFHTLDYRRVDEVLDGWLNASTGALHDEVEGRRTSSRTAIEAARTVAVPSVLSLAVTDLNEFDGTATVIAAVEVTVTPDGKQPEKKYMRIQGALERTGDGWKLNGIGQVDVVSS